MDGLHELSVGSLSRVCRPVEESVVRRKGKTSDRPALSTIERAAKEGENIRLVLRSAGAPFPPPEPSNDEPQPPFVVGLAHHRPSDDFLLFAFTSHTLPCRMARFDRDGKVITRNRIEGERNTAPFLWSEADAAVMVGAVNQCGSEYFERAARTEPDPETAGDGEGGEAEYIRLVPKVEGYDQHENAQNERRGRGEDKASVPSAESRAVRAIINELLCRPAPGGAGNFHHPDPNHLIPLAQSISAELDKWRCLRKAVPPPQKLPELPSLESLERMPTGGEELTAVMELELDEISSRRKTQLERSITLCIGALNRMESLMLPLAAPSGDQVEMYSSFQLGEECATSVAGITTLHKEHPRDWRDYHGSLDQVWGDNEKDFTSGNGDSDDTKDVDSDEEDESGCDGYWDAAYSLINSWVCEDRALEKALSLAASAVKTSMDPNNKQALHVAKSCVQSTRKEIERIREEAARNTIEATTTLVKRWNSPNSDDEADDDEEPWMQHGSYPPWSRDEVDAHIAFGWRVSEGEAQLPMNFTVDHVGLAGTLRGCIRSIDLHSSRRRDYDDGDDYLRQESKFDSFWDEHVKPTIDASLNAAKQFLADGDLRNGSLILSTCSRVLCDASLFGEVRKWFDDPDGSYGSEKMIVNKFQATKQPFDVQMIRTSLAYFDVNLPRIAAGAGWLYDILRSGALFLPSAEHDISWINAKGVAFCGGNGWLPRWHRYSHPADAIFMHGGWRHPALCAILQGSDLPAIEWMEMEAPAVIKERFNTVRQQGNTQGAIALARLTSGDHDCMHYLVCNGLANEAIVQASSSRNIEGLAGLSSELIKSDPFASALCSQAHILAAIENLPDNVYRQIPEAAIDTIANNFLANWPVSQKAQEQEVVGVPATSSNVPSLHLRCTLSLIQRLLTAAKSTHEMQAILENEAFAESGISLAAVFVAIVAQAIPRGVDKSHLAGSLQHFVAKCGLFSAHGRQDIVTFSGSLTRFGRVPASLGQKNFLDICCALYVAAMFLMQTKGCNAVFCFDLALYSSVQIAFQTGCRMFALDTIQSVKELDEERFELYSSSPMNSLTACYADLFSAGNCSCPQISEALVETFLKMNIIRSKSCYGDYISALGSYCIRAI